MLSSGLGKIKLEACKYMYNIHCTERFGTYNTMYIYIHALSTGNGKLDRQIRESMWLIHHMMCISPIPSMYGIFTYIYHKNQPNVGIYTIHGSYGLSTGLRVRGDVWHVFGVRFFESL